MDQSLKRHRSDRSSSDDKKRRYHDTNMIQNDEELDYVSLYSILMRCDRMYIHSFVIYFFLKGDPDGSDNQSASDVDIAPEVRRSKSRGGDREEGEASSEEDQQSKLEKSYRQRLLQKQAMRHHHHRSHKEDSRMVIFHNMLTLSTFFLSDELPILPEPGAFQ